MSLTSSFIKKSPYPLLYVIPYIIWLYLIHGFYSQGQLNLSMDTRDFYFYTNYFLNHIQRGVYPLWNPFSSWGRPDDLLALMIGGFNPFLYLIVGLEKLGIGFTVAYLVYLITYFSVGIAGATCLAQKLFRSPLLTWMVFISLLLSNLSSNLFFNLLVILIFVPSIWFFYSLISFTEKPKKSSLLGVTFCLMIIMTTYMPFHFFVVLMTFLIGFLVLYFKSIKSIALRYGSFILKNKKFFLFCLFSLGLSVIPGLLWYRSSLNADFIASWRGGDNPLFVNKGMIDTGSIVSMHTLQNVISNLQDYSLANFFLPLFFMIILLMGFIVPLSRRRILLFSLGLFIFLVCMLSAASIHPFLYKHIFFFKYFRNVHFLFWGFSMILILFVVDLLDGLMSLRPKSLPSKIISCLLVVVLHAAILIYLSKSWAVISSSYVTVALSCVLFILYFAGLIQQGGKLFYLLLFFLFLIQPTEVLWHVVHNVPPGQFPYSAKPFTYQDSHPRFSYLRPTIDEENQMVSTKDFGDIADRSGFPKSIAQYQGTRWSYNLIKQFSSQANLQQYVRHKFILYDLHQDPSATLSNDFPAGTWIEGNSDQFKVIHFDMNVIEIKTKLNQDRWLVYNDNFYQGWNASVNGHQVPIFRANGSFKGIYLPAGENHVKFSFHTSSYRAFYLFLIIYFHIVMGVLIFFLWKGKRYSLAH
jgi:hypothetical protein